MSKTYVLEVVEFLSEKNGENGWLKSNGKLKHIGYMKAKFKTKNNASSYYDRHNPHMRSLNAHHTYRSDWDPDTKLLYIVREDYAINDDVETFSKNDMPNQTDNVTTYKWLK